MFGTESGYDRGGDDPVCSVSILKPRDESKPAGHVSLSLDGEVPPGPIPNFDIQELDNRLMSGSFDSSEILPNCYNGTSFIVSSSKTHLYTNDTLHVQLDLELDPSPIDSNEEIHNSSISFYSRVIICNVVWGGFCTPLATVGESQISVTKSPWNTADNPTLKQPGTAKSKEKISLQIPADLPSGDYLVVGHVVASFVSPREVIRYDVANAISERIVQIRKPPTVLETTLGAKLWLGCLIGICASIALFMLIYLIVQREQAILKLAQGNFLAAISLACFVQIVCSFVFLPTYSIFCGLFGMLILLPMTFVASCLVGRVWRVHKTLFIAQTLGRRTVMRGLQQQGAKQAEQVEDGLLGFLDFLAKLPCRCSKSTPMNTRRSIRNTVSDWETMGLIGMLTMPQLFFQLAVAINGRTLVSIEDEGGAVSRMSCDVAGRWTTAVGLSYLMIIYILAVSMAWVSRSLPSAFNEKDQIFRTAAISTALAFLSMILWKPITDAATSPFLSVLLQATLSISVSMIVLFTIIWPKIQRCRSGEKVVLSRFVSDRSRSQIQPVYSFASRSNGSLPSSIAFDRRSRQSSKRSELERTSSQLPTIRSGVEEDHTDSSCAEANQSIRTLVMPDDPLPAQIEAMILGMQGNLQEITKKL